MDNLEKSNRILHSTRLDLRTAKIGLSSWILSMGKDQVQADPERTGKALRLIKSIDEFLDM